jgi:hypothetical protein
MIIYGVARSYRALHPRGAYRTKNVARSCRVETVPRPPVVEPHHNLKLAFESF